MIQWGGVDMMLCSWASTLYVYQLSIFTTLRACMLSGWRYIHLKRSGLVQGAEEVGGQGRGTALHLSVHNILY